VSNDLHLIVNSLQCKVPHSSHFAEEVGAHKMQKVFTHLYTPPMSSCHSGLVAIHMVVEGFIEKEQRCGLDVGGFQFS